MTRVMECGERRLVGGQEDMIIDIALNLVAAREPATVWGGSRFAHKRPAG